MKSLNNGNEVIRNLFLKDKMGKRVVAILLATITMGFSLSLLVNINMGTDPCSSMNLGISRLLGISFGNWMVVFNFVLFMFVMRYDYTQIGVGSFANMILVGYAHDFFQWIWSKSLPDGTFQILAVRIALLFPALMIFVIAAAVYMAMDLGSGPYDAIPFILSNRQKKLNFRTVRMSWDIGFVTTAFFLGSTIGIITVFIAFALGPVIVVVKKKISTMI